MKTFIGCLSLLSLLSSAVLVQGTFFSSLKDLAEGKSEGKASSQGNRKVVLVPRTVYVPVYTSDDGTLTEEVARQPLNPISPVVLGSGGVAPPPRQFSIGDLSAIYAAQPPPATYAMYSPPSQQLIDEQSAAAAQAFPYYPPGYGAVGPQFQYAAAPQFDMSAMMQQYPVAIGAVNSPPEASYYQVANNDTAPADDGNSNTASSSNTSDDN